jgi:glycosyltransferase involved in cell wall biosynthesis
VADTPALKETEDGQAIELSIVMPCLNEAETLEVCIERHKGSCALSDRGEVIVADNGSTDGSQCIAEKIGARVVPVPERGYGAR